MFKKPSPSSMLKDSSYTRRKRRLSPLMLIGISVPVLLALIGVGVFIVIPHVASHADAANPNMDCTLMVPANPLTAQGLTTPYQLSATDAANGPCNEANANQSAFVQGVIYNPASGQFSIYSPLVIDQGTQPAIAPTAPTLPAGAVVGLWFGFNGNNLTLQGAQGNTLTQGRCVNGSGGTVFGQFAYCNAVNFFNAARRGIANGLVKVPPLATAKDGMPCPTTRDFSVIDQDQSDNVQTQYLANGNGQTAQFSTANQGQIPNATPIANPSDNALLTTFIDPTLGCQSWQAPDLTNNNTMTSALPLDEIQAAMFQKAPVALVPLTDPMTLLNNNQNLTKTNLYRRGADQTPAGNNNAASGTTYCQNFVNTGLPRIKLDMPLTMNATSPVPAMANSLFTFLASRAMASYTNLNCQNLLNQPNPVTVQMDGNGVVTSATITLPNAAGGTGAGGVQQIATGTANIRLNPRAASAQVNMNITYPNHPNQAIDVNLVQNSCTGTPVFTRMENTGGNSTVMANTTVNNLQNVQAIPSNWFMTVTDPTQANAPVVGCGAIVPNGTSASVTLGTVTATPPTTCPTVTATTPATMPTVAATTPATAGTTPTVAATTPATTGAAPTVAATTPATTPTVAATSTPCTTGTGTGTGSNPQSPPTPPAWAGSPNGKNYPFHPHRSRKW